jgi:hypothetical protein
MLGMLGFVVTSADARTTVEATHYDVLDDGELVLRVGPKVCKCFDPADWITVEPMGTRLAASWPPTNFEPLLDSVRGSLAAHGYYVHELENRLGFRVASLERGRVAGRGPARSRRCGRVSVIQQGSGQRCQRPGGSTLPGSR